MTKIIVKPGVTGKRPQTQVLQVLKKARALVAGEVDGVKWRKHGWLSDADGITCVCAEGAIQAAVRGVRKTSEFSSSFVVINQSMEGYWLERDAIQACEAVLPKRWQSDSLWGWNDAPSRTRSQVVALFDKAIAKVEAEK